MKKRMLCVFFALFMIIADLPVFASEGMSGSGTKTDPYIIESKEDLLSLQNLTLSGKYYKLNNDINFNGEEMQPIKKFGGATFDGQKHTISNIKLTGTTSSALFLELSSNAEIKDLVIKDATVTVTNPSLSYGSAVLAGKIVGSSTITNCGVDGGTVSTSSSNGFVVGGLLGYAYSKTIIDGCYSTANVVGNTSLSTTVGGLIGKTYDSVTISNSYSIANINNKTEKAGGIIGYQATNYQVDVVNCYCVPTFSSKGYAFSYFYGSSTKYSFTNCYYDGDICNYITDNNKTGITKKTTDEIKKLSSTLGESFKSDNTLNNGYPSLFWQKSKGPQNIKLTVDPVDAEVSLFGENNAKISHSSYSNGEYVWEKMLGTFSYTVSKEGYQTVLGIINSGENLSLVLKPVYNLKFNADNNVTVVLKDKNGNVVSPKSEFSYFLTNGEYTYEASADGYKSITETILVNGSDITKNIVLEKFYDLKFDVDVSNCEVVLSDKQGNEIDPVNFNEFVVTNGEYIYSILKYGYIDVTGSITVNGKNETKTINMIERTPVNVNFSFTEILDNEELEKNPITVKYGDSVLSSTDENGFSYKLYEGYGYTYSFESGSYTKRSGNIDLSNPNILIELVIRKSWDGETMREPKTDKGYYLISHGDELYWFANQVNKKDKGNIKAKLTKDIDLGGYNCEPIGSTGHIFKGEFDGQGHKITNVYINNNNTYRGFFGYVGSYGYPVVIKNLELQGTIQSNNSSGTGGVVGAIVNGTIENCINRINVTGGNNVGGIVGCVMGSDSKTINNCINYGSICGNNSVGGIFGQVGGYKTVTASNCINIGNITVNMSKAGGILGYLYCSDAVISDCYTIGSIIKGQYATSEINPAIGKKEKGSVENMYFKNSLGNDTNGVKMTDEEIKNLSNNQNNGFYFDYDNVNNGYPILKFMVNKNLNMKILNDSEYIKTYGVLKDCVFVVSCYDTDDILVNTKSYNIKKDISVKKSEISNSSANVYFKAFLFESVENLSPLVNPLIS